MARRPWTVWVETGECLMLVAEVMAEKVVAPVLIQLFMQPGVLEVTATISMTEAN